MIDFLFLEADKFYSIFLITLLFSDSCLRLEAYFLNDCFSPFRLTYYLLRLTFTAN